MNITGWPNRLGWLLLVLGLAAGPWPAAIAATAPVPHPTAAMAAMDEDAPCPMEAHAVTPPPCHCCDDGAPCTASHCAVSTPAPGLPVNANPIAMIPDGAIHDAVAFTTPPDPRPGERLRPPIA